MSIFSGHLLRPVFQSSLHITLYKLFLMCGMLLRFSCFLPCGLDSSYWSNSKNKVRCCHGSVIFIWSSWFGQVNNPHLLCHWWNKRQFNIFLISLASFYKKIYLFNLANTFRSIYMSHISLRKFMFCILHLRLHNYSFGLSFLLEKCQNGIFFQNFVTHFLLSPVSYHSKMLWPVLRI